MAQLRRCRDVEKPYVERRINVSALAPEAHFQYRQRAGTERCAAYLPSSAILRAMAEDSLARYAELKAKARHGLALPWRAGY